jgi:3-hydroxyethyl bacteriochlorophyllide a dehydrogenase
MKTQALLFEAQQRVALATIDIPEPEAGELLVRTAYTCISPGTELRCLAGRQPGSPEYPFIPGYALTGIVEAAGPATKLQPGTPILCSGTQRASVSRCWGGHTGLAVLREERAFVLPQGISLMQASIAPMAAIAYHGLRVARPMMRERVAALGLGLIGQMAARLYLLAGTQVVAADRSPTRVRIAKQAGVEAVVVQQSLQEALQPYLPEGADLIVDSTGVPAVIPQAVALAKDLPWDDTPVPPARYLIQGSYPDEFAIPYQEAFLKELTFQIPRNYQPGDLRAVLDLIAAGRLNVDNLIGSPQDPAQAQEIYASLQDPYGERLTAVFAWNA